MKVSLWFCGSAFVTLVAVAVAQSSRARNSVPNLRSNLKSIETKKDRIEGEMSKTRRATHEVLGEVKWVDRELGRFDEAIEATSQRLRVAQSEQQELVREVERVNASLERNKALLQTRLRAIYMQVDPSGMSALLMARSLSELASRRTVMERIAESDRELFDKVQRDLEQARDKKKRQDAVVVEIRDLVSRQRNYERELKGARAKKAGLLGELRERSADLNEQYEDLERESRRIEAQIRAFYVRQRAISGGTGTFRGGFIRPSRGRISSGFGMRFHPVLRRNRMHNGIDIAAPTGTPIVASAAGTVISTGYFGGYGNTVIIDHGGGVSTLYAHCSRVFVRAGQRVRQGERIAAVGSTGLSTGPHLHFEIRINGRPINPMSRL